MLLTIVQQALSMVAAAAVTIGVIVAILQLRNQNRLRQLEIVMRLYSSFGQESFLSHYHRVTSWKYGSYKAFRKRNSDKDYISLLVVSVFFENMGLLYKRGLAPLDLIDDLLSGPVLQSWSSASMIWRGLRAEYHHPAWAEWFEFLHDAMAKRLADVERR
jgi:hypothetical protein